MKLIITMLFGLDVLLLIYVVSDEVITNIKRNRELKKSREETQRQNEALLKEAKEFLKQLKK